MLSYNEQGFRVHDLGGIAVRNNPDTAGIDQFKVGFGGRTASSIVICAEALYLGALSCGY